MQKEIHFQVVILANMFTLQDLIKAVEKSTVTHRCDDGWDHNLIDADILIQELKKMEE